MAGFVKAFHLHMVFGACVGMCFVAPTLAQQLQDPTRPPAMVSHGEEVVTEGPVLQSVLIGPNRKVAIISGQAVALGEQFNGAKLVSVSETQVVLRNGSELQTLKLFPDVDKRRSSIQADTRSAAGKTHRKQ
jgi:MSHA biogenesis protein MshK